jgi:hypothetical protein
VNPVERRILELASFQLGQKKKYIRAVCRKPVIPNRRYSWMMFEHPADTDPVEVVVLDVNLTQALQIDRSLAETFKNTLVLAIREGFVPSAD